MRPKTKPLAAEFLGTFGLVFAGTGAIVIDNASHGAITHVGVAITFGLIVLAMIYAFGDVSGAHLNPVVSAAFAVARARICAGAGIKRLFPRYHCHSSWGFVSEIVGRLTLTCISRDKR